MRRRTVLASIIVAAITGLLASALAMHVVAVSGGLAMPAPYLAPALIAAATVVQTAVGGVIVWRRVRNAVGWCLLGLAMANALNGFASGYAELGVLVRPRSLPGADAALVFQNAGWVLVYAALTTLALVFPDGRLPSPRWRPGAAGVGLATLTAGATVAVSPGPGNPPFDHAYFVACEALTNAVKHARASCVTVRTARENAHLVVRVEDDGVGGARLVPGSGLAGLADRVDAHGGRLRVGSRADGGTLVEAELPCES